jgi:hypothetical protein
VVWLSCWFRKVCSRPGCGVQASDGPLPPRPEQRHPCGLRYGRPNCSGQIVQGNCDCFIGCPTTCRFSRSSAFLQSDSLPQHAPHAKVALLPGLHFEFRPFFGQSCKSTRNITTCLCQPHCIPTSEGAAKLGAWQGAWSCVSRASKAGLHNKLGCPFILRALAWPSWTIPFGPVNKSPR